MDHRCGAVRANGQKCKQRVDNAGERCRYHQATEVSHQPSGEEVELNTPTASEMSHDVENVENVVEGPVNTDATSEVMNALLAKINLLEAELKKATALNRKPVATASKPTPTPTTVKSAPSSSENVKKKRNMTPAGALQKARWIYYQEHKSDHDVLGIVRGGLLKGEILARKVAIVNGTVVEKEVIPYTLVKIATDSKFDKLSQEEKEAYMLEAYESNEARAT